MLKKNNATDEQKMKAENTGVLLSSGLIAGEALTAVILAFVVLGVNLSEGSFQLAHLALFEPQFFLGLLAFAGLAYMLIIIPFKRSQSE